MTLNINQIKFFTDVPQATPTDTWGISPILGDLTQHPPPDNYGPVQGIEANLAGDSRAVKGKEEGFGVNGEAKTK
jgi:hypothetical protein